MDIGPTAVAMRTFGETLSVNRLRQAQRNGYGEVLLRRPLMEPSTSAEFCENGNVLNLAEMQPPNQRYSDCTETYPAPPSNLCLATVNEQEGGRHEPVELRGGRGGGGSPESEGTDIDEEVSHSTMRKTDLVPTKSQVLFYVSSSSHLKIHHTGHELQITDSSDFPLLDVWAESVCCSSPVWVVEAYGRRVLVLSETRFSSTLSSFLPRPIAALLGIRRVSAPCTTILDWNGDIMGILLPGDPLIIQNGSRSTVARCQRIDQHSNNWQCVLESTGREIARAEDGNLHFSTELSFQLKLLVIAALTRAVGRLRSHNSCLPFR